MSIESKSTLQGDTLEQLQELIQFNRDSREGLHKVADYFEQEQDMTTLFRGLAMQRGLHAEQLRQLVAGSGEKPVDGGSTVAKAHRMLIDVREALGGGRSALLAEARRGEGVIKSKYEDALKRCAGSAATDVLNQQYAEVKAAHDRLCELSATSD